MAKARLFYKKVSRSKQYWNLPNGDTRNLFDLLIAHSDDNGCMEGDPTLVRTICMPLAHYINDEQVAAMLQAMHNEKLIYWWFNKNDGYKYIKLPNFSNHQNLRYKKRGDLPEPPGKEYEKWLIENPFQESGIDDEPLPEISGKFPEVSGDSRKTLLYSNTRGEAEVEVEALGISKPPCLDIPAVNAGKKVPDEQNIKQKPIAPDQQFVDWARGEGFLVDDWARDRNLTKKMLKSYPEPNKKMTLEHLQVLAKRFKKLVDTDPFYKNTPLTIPSLKKHLGKMLDMERRSHKKRDGPLSKYDFERDDYDEELRKLHERKDDEQCRSP